MSKKDNIINILLVEDEAIIAANQKFNLERYNSSHKVTTVSTGEKAYEIISSNKKFDVVLMDINLGKGMDGTETAKKILFYKEIPIIFLSNYSEESVVRKTENINTYGFVNKTSNITVINTVIVMAMNLFASKQKLKEINEYNEAMLEAMPDMMFVFNKKGYFIDFKASNSNKMILLAENFINKHHSEVLPENISKLTENYLINVFDKYESQKYQYDIEINNQNCYFQTHLVPFGDDKAIAIVQDITKRKEAELIKQFKYEFHKLVAETSIKLITSTQNDDFEHTVNSILKNVGELFRVDRTYIFSFSKDLMTMTNTHKWSKKIRFSDISNSKVVELNKFQWFKKNIKKFKPIIIDDVEKMSDESLAEKERFKKQGIRSLLCLPIIDSIGNLTGFMGLDNLTEKMEWNEECVPMLQLVALTIGIVNQRLINENKINNQNIKLKNANTEKEVLIKEVHHRVKNNLQIIQSILSMQKLYLNNSKETSEVLEDTINRIKSMSTIHENLYQVENLATIDMKDYVTSQLYHLHASYTYPTTVVRFYPEINNIIFDIDKAINTGLLLNEIVSNSLKHAFKERETGNIEVILRKEDDNYILIVRDDGIGIPENIEISEDSDTYGFTLIYLFLSQLKAKYNIKRKNGTEFYIVFK